MSPAQREVERPPPPGLSRRSLLRAGLLAGVAGVSVAGCTAQARPQVADPDEAAIAEARRGELSLLANYVEGDPRRTAHLAHLQALGASTPPPAAATAPTDARTASAAEAASVPPLQAAAVAATGGDTAALLAGIAGSHATFARIPRS